ncbi:MAG: TniB family NTP-binding protein [Lachnospiraceae bacterium]|nr:TniB family NTP-binding protein [Lachnospiraceae bacterium]
MSKFSDVIHLLPAMKSGDELVSALEVLPEYDVSVINEDVPVRLTALSDLYRIYVPSSMSLEIYSKLYLSLLRSLQKKGTKLAVQQRYENNKAMQQKSYSGILGGADSFTIIGASGIGKSSAISRAISLITEHRVIEIDEPYCRIIPCLIVQCPFDSSVKGLLLEILRKADEELGTNYYHHAVRSRTSTVDVLIGLVSTIALNHIGLLVVDEIQNVANSKNGRSLVGMLTQLINNSGISICMVGTSESAVFFEQAMQLARRSLGLRYDAMEYGNSFRRFCSVLFSYQYVEHRTEITEGIVEWLYEHTSGNTSVVVSLIHDAQEIAILNGKEVLNLETLNEAYRQRLSMLHGFIQPVQKNQTSKVKRKESAGSIEVRAAADGRKVKSTSSSMKVEPSGGSIKPSADTMKSSGSSVNQSYEEDGGDFTIAGLVSVAKSKGADIVYLLKRYLPVVEVAV